jgi:hypothetical protein
VKALEKLRKELLTWPDTTEATHFDKASFKVGKQMFVTASQDGEVVVQLEPEHASMLIENDQRFTAYPRAKHCVSFQLDAVSEWKALIRESYQLRTAPKKKPAKPAPRRR